MTTIAERTSTWKATRVIGPLAGIEPLQLSVHRELPGLADEWQALEERSGASLFQSWTWLEAWSRVAMQDFAEQPVIVVGRDASGNARLVLPLAVARCAGVKVLTRLAQSHTSLGLALVDRALPLVAPEALQRIVHEVARAEGAAVIHLSDLPLRWQGAANPMAALANRPAANDCFVLQLELDWSRQYERLFSSRTRALLRRKRRRLEEIGTVRIERARTEAERLRLLGVFFAQKDTQLAAAGAPNAFAIPAVQAHYRALARSKGQNRLEIDALYVGEQVAAVVLAMRHGDCEYMLNTSMADGPIRDQSPGRLLMHAHVEAAHRSGARTYDFGPGDASHKQEWEPTLVPLVTALEAVSPLGLPAVAWIGAGAWGKRSIKRSPRLLSLAVSVRRWLGALRAMSGRRFFSSDRSEPGPITFQRHPEGGADESRKRAQR